MTDPVERLADALAERITPAPVETAPRPVLRRWGTIAVVNATGTYDVELGESGVVIPAVRALGYGAFVAGETVVVEFAGSDPLIMGTADGQDGWHIPALANGWVNYGFGWAGAQYRKIHGVVHLEGLVKDGTVAFGGTGRIFTLDARYRPLADLLFEVDTGTGHGRCDVLADGTVNAVGGGNAYFTLSGIHFVAEQ